MGYHHLQSAKGHRDQHRVSLVTAAHTPLPSHFASHTNSPWNYPVIIALYPLLGAIAAGCTCVVKPSELSPTVSSLLADLLPKYLDTDAYAVVNGAIPETKRLLELKWDHIFFTGSTTVGRIIAAGAAKQLTPVTLELGGKSPVFIDSDNTDLEIAAGRVLWGRSQNAGQVSFLLGSRGSITLIKSI